jgi:colanic acid/amylovoran biosynthesis glycosyltransferase
VREERPRAVHLVTPFLFPTGSWIYDQIRLLRRYDALVATSALENTESFPWPFVTVIPSPPGSRRGYLSPSASHAAITRFVQLSRVLKDASVAHAHFGPEGFNASFLSKLTRTPLIVSFYGYDLTQLPTKFRVWRHRYRRLFGRAAAVLVEGTQMHTTLLELGCPPEKAIVQKLGIDVSAIPFTPRHATQTPRLLVAASFREKKGIPYALEAVANVRRGGLDARLTLIGEGPDAAEIEATINRLNLQEIVVRRPYVSHAELVAEYASHDILLQPSVTARDGDSEGGTPVTIIEAAASGMPIVATNHCDIPEVVVDGRGGILVPERNASAVADAIRELITEGDEWQAIAEFNRAHIESHYNAHQQIDRLETIYDTVAI